MILTERSRSDGKARCLLCFYLCNTDSCNIFQYRSCWVGRWLTVCWVDLSIFVIPGEFCHFGCSGSNKVGREHVSGWQPKLGNTILMHLWEELSSLVVAKEKLLPHFPWFYHLFLHCSGAFWVGRTVQWCSRAHLGLAQGELDPYTVTSREWFVQWCWQTFPKWSLFLLLNQKNQERWFCSHLLAFQVNKNVWHEMFVVNAVCEMEEKGDHMA